MRKQRIGVRIGNDQGAGFLAETGRTHGFGRLLEGIFFLRVEELRVGLDTTAKIVTTHGGRLPALQRPQQEVGRCIVVLLGGPAERERLAACAETNALDSAGTGAVRVAEIHALDLVEIRGGYTDQRPRNIAGTERKQGARGIGQQRLLRERAIAHEHRITFRVGSMQRDVAPPVIGVCTQQQVDFAVLTIALGSLAVLVTKLDAFEVVTEDEIDRTGDGVRAVNRRGAAGNDFHPLYQHVGNGGQIDKTIDVAGYEAPPVNQHQGTHRAEPTQVGRQYARATALIHRTGIVRIQLWKLVDRIFESYVA